MKFQLYTPQAIHELGKRKNQEDTIFPEAGLATADDRLFLVCDGMGGHDKGEVASAAVCQGMAQAIEDTLPVGEALSDQLFGQALAQAFDTLDAADVNCEGKMGTTMTFLCLHKGGCLVAHIGDSRIYHLRPQSGQVLYRSRDHSLVQQLYELGEISYNEMGTSQRKNIILKAMQPFQEERSKATLVHITDIRPGDYFYLCSDGMLENMEDDELLSILNMDVSDEEKAAELINRTEENADNHSAYLIHVKDVEHEPGDEQLLSDEEEARRKNKALNDTRKDEVWDMVAKDSPVITTPPQGTMMQKVSKKKYVYLLILLLLAIAAAAFLLFNGKGDKGDKDEDSGKGNDTSTELVVSEDEEDEDENEDEEDGETSVKEEILRQKDPANPDPEPQSLKPQASEKNMPGVNYNDVIEF
ncbi:MAG: serine/threonine-protein phosphatase [Prevotella sp.]|nr:serine/threonine-protein phosphatase [Prevotella sp.]